MMPAERLICSFNPGTRASNQYRVDRARLRTSDMSSCFGAVEHPVIHEHVTTIASPMSILLPIMKTAPCMWQTVLYPSRFNGVILTTAHESPTCR